jgi:hypothetical protein
MQRAMRYRARTHARTVYRYSLVKQPRAMRDRNESDAPIIDGDYVENKARLDHNIVISPIN